MATFAEQALALVDRLEAQAKQNEQEFGSAFAPLPEHERAILHKSNQSPDKRKEPEISIEALKAKIDATESQLKAALNPQQLKLFDKLHITIAEQKAALPPIPESTKLPFDRLKRAQEEGDILEAERIMEEFKKNSDQNRKKWAEGRRARQHAQDEIDSAYLQFKKTLQPEQLELMEKLNELYFHRSKYENNRSWKQSVEKDKLENKDRDDKISKILSAVKEPEEPKEILSIPLSNDSAIASDILQEACRRSGSIYGGDCEAKHYNQQLHLIRPSAAPAIDFQALRDIIGEIGAELADSSPWKKVERTSRGIAYECEEDSPFVSSLASMIIIQLRYDPKYRGDIKQGPYIRGIIHDDIADKMSLDMDERLEALLRSRISGQAVKDILIDGFGIQGLEMPPQRHIS